MESRRSSVDKGMYVFLSESGHLTKEQYVNVVTNRSIFNHDEIAHSRRCGCYHCKSTFNAGNIIDWVDDEQTAVCPLCFQDTVIGDGSVHEACSKSLLDHMHFYGFRHGVSADGNVTVDGDAPCEQCTVETCKDKKRA